MTMNRVRRQRGEGTTKRIDLSRGASVTLVLRGNIFDLSKDEQGLVFNLTNVLQKYKDAENGQQGVVAMKA